MSTDTTSPIPVAVGAGTNANGGAPAAAHTYELDIVMSCGGCSGAINRKLSKMSGIQSYTVSLETQTALVKTDESVTSDSLYKSLAATGKTIKSLTADGEKVDIEGLKA